MVQNLGLNNSILNKYISELRDVRTQNDKFRFRKNLERIGEIFAYEISKELEYEKKEITSPLGTSEMNIIKDNIVLATVLRAGLPLHQGLLNFFDQAQNAFIGSYRKYHKDNSFEIKSEYISSPSVEDKFLILSDPMLASGSSMLLAYKDLTRDADPKHLHLVTVIAAREGIEFIQDNLQEGKYTIWTGAIDQELTAKSYIVPGLGDAGDLAFGDKN
ncbi:MAG: uracil phosphoribosyltransferase [Ignavibacteriaceae bacterium]|jgi:uracil phosphoribosyltransferase|nr:uracil phosphoribosyltransferase [Ignavibacteriaceae bacterium]